MGELWTFFILLSEEWGGLAYIRLAGGLQREIGLGCGDLCEGEGSPCWWRLELAPSSLPALGLRAPPSGPPHVALGTASLAHRV